MRHFVIHPLLSEAQKELLRRSMQVAYTSGRWSLMEISDNRLAVGMQPFPGGEHGTMTSRCRQVFLLPPSLTTGKSSLPLCHAQWRTINPRCTAHPQDPVTLQVAFRDLERA